MDRLSAGRNEEASRLFLSALREDSACACVHAEPARRCAEAALPGLERFSVKPRRSPARRGANSGCRGSSGVGSQRRRSARADGLARCENADRCGRADRARGRIDERRPSAPRRSRSFADRCADRGTGVQRELTVPRATCGECWSPRSGTPTRRPRQRKRRVSGRRHPRADDAWWHLVDATRS